MIFNKLTVTNLGNFAGTFEFNLRGRASRERRPIVLFGGLNGAGKTTVFDAIKLCLYGPEMFGYISVTKYQEYLKQKIHSSKTTALQPNHAAIALEFDYAHMGSVCTYRVERFWEMTGQKVAETLTVTRNSMALDDVERDGWQDFIKEIIPLGLSQLFFFDGEKIQKMMSDDSNEELKKSILSLLGLDLVERLQADLKIYRNKSLHEAKSSAYAQEMADLEEKWALVDDSIRRINNEKAGLQSSIDQLAGRIAAYRDKIAAQGEGYYRNRVNLEEKKRALEHEIEAIKEKLREMAAGLLPVAVAASYSLKVKRQVENENRHKATVLLADSLDGKCRVLLEQIDSKDFLSTAGVNASVLKQIKEQLKSEITSLFAVQEDHEAISEVFGFSQKQTIEILQAIDTALNTIPIDIKALTDLYEAKFRELQDTVSLLNKVPDEEFIQPMYETLDGLNVELGGLTEKRTKLDEQLAEVINNRNELERWIAQTERKIAASYELDEKLQTVLKVEKVLAAYHEQLAKQKIYALQEEFTTIFKMLHRKEDMIAKVKIDSQTFAVTLYDGQGAVISKGSLSSGELEIYAMSMLWALAKTSGQRLPFIVDTPLARLDSKHRDNLVELFFPYASHQMMIFSTNTEVDQQYFEQLQPYVAKAYNLAYSDETKSTVVKKGYFWN
jgi:DNA sulfur modification protein DndD